MKQLLFASGAFYAGCAFPLVEPPWGGKAEPSFYVAWRASHLIATVMNPKLYWIEATITCDTVPHPPLEIPPRHGREMWLRDENDLVRDHCCRMSYRRIPK